MNKSSQQIYTGCAFSSLIDTRFVEIVWQFTVSRRHYSVYNTVLQQYKTTTQTRQEEI